MNSPFTTSIEILHLEFTVPGWSKHSPRGAGANAFRARTDATPLGGARRVHPMIDLAPVREIAQRMSAENRDSLLRQPLLGDGVGQWPDSAVALWALSALLASGRDRVRVRQQPSDGSWGRLRW